MPYKKRFKKRATKKRRMRKTYRKNKSTPSTALVRSGYMGNRTLKFTQIFQIKPQPTAAGGNTGTCALVNISLLNPNFPGIPAYYTNLNPQVVQNFNFNITRQQYADYTITGCRVKMIFPRDPPIDINNRVASVEWAYDPNFSLADDVLAQLSNLAFYSNYQVGPIPLSYQATRFIRTGPILKRLGVLWCNGNDANYTYNNQLSNAVNPSLYFRVNFTGPVGVVNSVFGCELTYYYKFRGLDFGQNPA